MDLYIKLGIILVSLIAVWLVIKAIKKSVRRKIRNLTGGMFRTSDIADIIKQIKSDENDTPLSVGGGNSIYLPMIKRDFPDYHQTTMEEKIKRFMLTYYECLEKKDASLLQKAVVTDTVEEIVKSQVLDLGTTDAIRYDNIRVHAAAISGYVKTKELATVKYQASLEYMGGTNKKVQVKYSVDMTYLFTDMSVDMIGIRCNNCGGSLEETSTKCAYCGTLIVRNIDKVWRISNFTKLKQVG